MSSTPSMISSLVMPLPFRVPRDYIVSSVSVPIDSAPSAVSIANCSVMPVEHSLPFKQNLLVTTPNAIHHVSQTGSKIVFECTESSGIVKACAATDNSSLLAVAGQHVTLLCDAAKPRERRHVLKRAGVRKKNQTVHDSRC